MPEAARLSRRVMFAVPCLDGRVDMRFSYAMGETIRLGTQLGADFRVLYRGLNAMLPAVRNDLLRDALENQFDDIFFIDADQDWEPEWVVRLLQHPVDCVGAAIRKKTDDAEVYNVRCETAPIPRDPATGLLVVDGVGTGFMRLSKLAMRALWALSEEYVDDSGRRNRWCFDLGPFQGRLVGEDTAMCLKLQGAGIKVHVDPAINCGHTGTKRWAGDFGKWLAALEAPKLNDPGIQMAMPHNHPMDRFNSMDALQNQYQP